MNITKYKHVQIIKHALQYYVNRPNAEFEKHIESELNLLKKFENEAYEMQERYDIKAIQKGTL
jgi:hypothetical protein